MIAWANEPAYSLDDFEPERSVGYLVKRIHAEGTAAMERLFADSRLTFTQWAALMSVRNGKGRTCASMARDMGHDLGATSRVIAALEERGLIARERSADDRRVVHLALTAEGEALAAEQGERLMRLWNRWLDGWSRDELDCFIDGLRRLRTTLEREREDGA